MNKIRKEVIALLSGADATLILWTALLALMAWSIVTDVACK